MRRAAIAIVLLATLAACGGGRSKGPLAVGCTPGSYPGQRAGDCLAGAAHRFVVAVDGYEVLVGNWKRTIDDTGRRLICAGVNVEDVATSAVPVHASLFHLRPPAGASQAAGASESNSLATTVLSPTQQEGGSICWSDHGTGGQYVASFDPPVRTPHRGIWLISFVAG